MQGYKILEIFPLGPEVVDNRLFIHIAKRHAAKQHFMIGEPEMLAGGFRPLSPGLLRAGMQAIFARQQHDILHEHTDIGILPDFHLPVEDEKEADWRIKKPVITRQLLELAGQVPPCNAYQFIERLPDNPPPGPVGIDEFRRIDFIFRGLDDAVLPLGTNIVDQRLKRHACHHMDVPGLEVAT